MTEIKELIKKYNILACPKSGVPKLTPTGKVSKIGLKYRKDRIPTDERKCNA